MTGEALAPATLIICTRDRPSLVDDAVASVLTGDELPDELLVVDQSREPNESLATLVHPRTAVRYLRTETVGLSRGRNLGIAEARHPVIVFIDDDVIVPPTWFGTIVRSLGGAGPRAVVTGRVLAGTPESDGAFAPSLHPGAERAVYEGRIGQDPLATFNLAMPREASAAAGGFDVRLGPGTPYPAGEDNDFGHRLLDAGWRIVFDPDAVVFHRAWRDEGTYAPLRHAYGRGQGAFFAKHVSIRDGYMLRRWTGTLVGHLRRLPRAAIEDVRSLRNQPGPAYWRSTARSSGRPDLVRAELAWIAGFFAGTVGWLRTRRRRR